ncbi:nucleotidyltransferase domain-containing protein [Desulfonatronum parangueonense]
MRLHQDQIENIREVVLTRDPAARIFLFGSRVDDQQRGGDIDLLVLSQKLDATDRRKMKVDLYRRIGHRKIDLLLAPDDRRAFVRLAMEEGVAL